MTWDGSSRLSPPPTGRAHTVGFNTVLILFHGIATFLVTLLALEFAPVAVAVLAGVVFAVHPIHVEATANVVGTAEVLSGLLVAAAALVHVRGGPRYGLGRTLAIGLLYGLAFLSKEGSVTFLGLVFLLDAFRRDLTFRDIPDYIRRRWLTYGVLLLVAVLVMLGRRAVLGTMASAIYPTGAHVLSEIPRIWTVLTTWPFYVQFLVFPLDLSADYGPRVIPIKCWRSWCCPGCSGGGEGRPPIRCAIGPWDSASSGWSSR
jgi:hypothetical protein